MFGQARARGAHDYQLAYDANQNQCVEAKVMAAATANYTLPKVAGAGSGCIDDTWTPTSTTDAPEARAGHGAVWTGAEMIVWGGLANGTNNTINTGARYDPSTDSWTPTSVVNAPAGRGAFTTLWTGTEMIVWGGVKCAPCISFNTGARYNPSTDTWVATTTNGAPESRWSHTAVWTGSEMIVWGGSDGFPVNSGGRYNPETDSWTATTGTNGPSARYNHTAVWTGSEMIVWGGYDRFSNVVNTGGRYNPVTDTWTPTSTTNAPEGRVLYAVIWSGSDMVIWGGGNDGLAVNSGGRYNPLTDTWVATSTVKAPVGRQNPAVVWTGAEMIVWGGYIYSTNTPFNTGGRYNPLTDTWVATSRVNAPSARVGHTGVWTGSEMIVWGGGYRRPFKSGGRYCPGPPMTLSAAIRKVEGINTVHLTWSGLSSEMIDVYRCVREGEPKYECDPIPIATTANDGAYTDSTGDTGRTSYKYRVCEAGTSTCSNTAEVPR